MENLKGKVIFLTNRIPANIGCIVKEDNNEGITLIYTMFGTEPIQETISRDEWEKVKYYKLY